MRNILPLLSAILLWSCGDSLPTEKPVEKGPLELTIDNEVYNFIRMLSVRKLTMKTKCLFI